MSGIFFLFLSDNYYPNWRVKVNDSRNNQSNWSSIYQVTINSDITITLQNDNINFTTLTSGDENDTLDNSPRPFNLTNDGNSFVNISINATDDLWTTQANPSQFFQFRSNETGETGSFNVALSNTTIWRNIPPITGLTAAIALLNYSNSNDSAEIEIRIQAPLDEPPGAKSAIINLLAELTSKTL